MCIFIKFGAEMAKSESYISFITDNLNIGIVERKKVMAKFVKKWQVSERTFDRAWKIANEQFTEHQIKLQKEKDDISIEAEKEAYKCAIIDKHQRMEILSQIAIGKIPLKKAIVVDKSIEFIDVIPDWMDRKNAISELNKMDGSYAPAKTEITGKDGKELKSAVLVVNGKAKHVPVTDESEIIEE